MCALRCTVLPITPTRQLSPTTTVVPPLSEKEGFSVYHPLPSIMSNSLRGCTTPSLLPCGRRGTATAVEDGELASLLEYHTHSLPNMHCLTNQLDPPAITHRYRGPPSFSATKKSHLRKEVGFLILGFRYLHTVIHCCNCSGNYLVNATATY